MKKFNITVLGKTYEVLVEDMGDVIADAPSTLPTSAYTTADVIPAEPEKERQIASPVSGIIREILVEVGIKVEQGTPLCILEAMEIQNTIPAPEDGIVSQIFVQEGSAVEAGTVLITLH
ncbi:MAG: biotin/lipoyl-binding protein [Clostridia bacterium]|nr:biotin/lipoyl-binding protein [Clostridia bacterium]